MSQDPKSNLRPSFIAPRFEPLTEEQAEQIAGAGDPHNAGLCALFGFACNEKGGVKFGVCVLYGFAGGGWTFIGGTNPPAPTPPPPPPPAPPPEAPPQG